MFACTLIVLAQFFDRGAVDFWGAGPRREVPPAWAEPGHTPPAPVARLIDTPSRENALAYLKWQEDRMGKLTAALRALENVRPSSPDEILYFTRPDCPFCALQDGELARADLKGRLVRRIGPRDAPELWRRYAITSTPALVVNGTILRGLSTRATIEGALKP